MPVADSFKTSLPHKPRKLQLKRSHSVSKNVARLTLGVQLRIAKSKQAKHVITNKASGAISYNILILKRKKQNPRKGNDHHQGAREDLGHQCPTEILGLFVPVTSITFTNVIHFERYHQQGYS